MNPDWCGVCKRLDDPGLSTAGSGGRHGGETKQDVVNDICDLLGIQRLSTSNGETEPSAMFDAAAMRLGLPKARKPVQGQAIIEMAGMQWHPDMDSRATVSKGGDNVTLKGLQALRSALRTLL